jgi:Protein of unknown function (DUF2510)
MFGSKRRAQKRAEEEAATRAQNRAELRDAVVKLTALAEGQDQPDPDWPLVLKHGERLFSEVRGAGLFEPRREAGHWEGRSAGVSVPVGDTGLRVRVGKSAGTYVQGVEKPTVIDTGNASITSERAVFQGDKYTREWDYSKLIGVVHYSDHPATAIQVSNREKTSGIVYAGVPSTEPLRLAMTVAIALYNGERDETLEELRTELARLDAATQAVPAVAAAGATATGAAVEPAGTGASSTAPHQPAPTAAPKPPAAAGEASPATPPPMWAADPHGRHQYRYWDGGRWTDYVADNGQESRDPPHAAPA